MKRIVSYILIAIAILLFGAMCAVVAYNFCAMQWGAKYECYSAPPDVAFLLAIPFVVGIALCLIVAFVLTYKTKQ